MLLVPSLDVFGQGYGGPSLLSRGGNAPGRRGRAPIDFTFYLSGRGLYETGLLRPVLDESGEIQPRAGYGYGGEWGVYGGHDWKRSSLGLDYRGDYREHSAIRSFTGSNHAVSLEYMNRVSRHVVLAFQQTGGTSNRAFGAFAAPAFGNLDRFGVPLNELFDIRVYYLQSGASATWLRSARTSFSGGADVFFIKRQNRSLINSQGFRVNGQAAYRYSARTTLNTSYQYAQFEFPRALADSNIHALSIGVDRQLTRNWSLSAVGGLFLVHSTGTQTVELSPEVAEILGRSTGVAAFRRTARAPLVQVTAGYTQERGRLTMSASSSMSAGNGVFLTGRRDTVNAGYSYTGMRRISFGVSAGYSRLNSLALTLEPLTVWQAGGGMNWQLARYLHFSTQLDRRSFQASSTRGREGWALTVGLGWSPGRFPPSIW